MHLAALGKIRGRGEQPASMIERVFTLAARYRQFNWALTDQAMVSGANFLTNIVMVRYLGNGDLAEYGRFVLAWMAIEFLRILHDPMIVAPMVSIGPKQRPEKAAAYYSAVNFLQFNLSLLASSVLVGIVVLLNIYLPSWNLGGMAPIMGFAAISYHLQQNIRRCAFARHRPDLAFASDAVRYLGQLAILIGLAQFYSLDSKDAILITASTAFLGIFCLLPVLGPVGFDRQTLKSTISRHWNFGKWLVPSAVLGRATADIFMAVAGAVIGAAAVGGLKAARNIVAVTHILLMGFENVVPIRAAQRFAEDGKAGLVRFLWRFGFASCGLVAGLILLVASIPEFWLELLYNGKFTGDGYLVQWWAAIYFLMFLAKPSAVGLRAMEYTRPIFLQNLILAAIGMSMCYPLINTFGVLGVLMGLAFLELFRVFFMTWSFRKHIRSFKS